MDVLEGDLYSQGLELNVADLDKSTAKTEIISECNKISKTLDGGLLVKLPFDAKSKDADIKKAIEKASLLISSFKPIKNTKDRFNNWWIGLYKEKQIKELRG